MGPSAAATISRTPSLVSVATEQLRVLVKMLGIVSFLYPFMVFFTVTSAWLFSRFSGQPFHFTLDVATGLVLGLSLTSAIAPLLHSRTTAEKLYFRSLPVGTGGHALMRFSVGSILMILISAVPMIVAYGNTTGEGEIAFWRWISPFVGATVVFSVVSAGTALNRWLVGVPLLVILYQKTEGVPLESALEWIGYGPLGIATAVTGNAYQMVNTGTQSDFVPHADLQRWLLASAFWVGLSLALQWFAVLRHREP